MLCCMVLMCSVNVGIVNGQVIFNTISKVNSMVDDVVFKSLLEVDFEKAELVQLSSKKCFAPMIKYIEKEVFAKGNSIMLDGDKIKECVVVQIKNGATKKTLSKKLLSSLKSGDFTISEPAPAKLTDEK